MPSTLRDIIETFQSVDPQTRMELLLDYSKKLPPLPAAYDEARRAGDNQVHECMTPVYLWVEHEEVDDALTLHAWVADEAPTVKGFVAIVLDALQGARPRDAEAIPDNLLEQLRLHDLIRMNRAVGLAAILARIKREAAA